MRPSTGCRGSGGRGAAARLVGAVAVLDCDVDQVLTVGDHELVVGRVVAVAGVADPDPDPLLFASSRFRALGGLPGQATSTSMSTGTPWVMTS